MNNKEFPKKIAENVILYSSNPILYLVKDFITKNECEAFVKVLDSQLTSDHDADNSQIIYLNNNFENFTIDHDANDLVHELSKRLSILAQTPIRNAEPYEVRHYKKGIDPELSFEAFDIASQRDKERFVKGGQMMLSTIFFLNDTNEESGFAFPSLKLSIPAKQGDVVVLHNTDVSNSYSEYPEIHSDSIHAPIKINSDNQMIGYLRFREGLLY